MFLRKTTGALFFLAILLTALFPVSALAGVVSDESSYGTAAATVSSTLTNLTSTNPMQAYPWSTTPTEPYTAILSADTGYSLPLSITVQRVQYINTDSGELLDTAIVANTYVADTDYTYNASTGEIIIQAATLNDIVYDPSPYNIVIVASGVLDTAYYTITVTQSAHGTITPPSADTVTHGSDITFTLTPDTGYVIADVLVDGNSAGAASSYTFTNVVSDHSITALFEEISATQPPADDDQDDNPQTGGSSPWTWILLWVISAAGIISLRQSRREKTDK